jgi:hypothetical protein
MPKIQLVRAFFVVAALYPPSVLAAPITYTNQSVFQAQLGDYTLVNLDAAPLSAFASGYRVDDAAPAAAFLAMGIDFFGYNAQVVAGQNGQTPTDRDRLIANGVGFGGLIAVNFVNPVNGIGAWSNNIDGGLIRVFSGANLGGTFLGQVPFGPGSFGGLTSDVLIGSAQFTCDFNSDLRCGVYDIQFGTFAEPGTAVPEPATLTLLGVGLAGLAARKRKRAGWRA